MTLTLLQNRDVHLLSPILTFIPPAVWVELAAQDLSLMITIPGGWWSPRTDSLMCGVCVCIEWGLVWPLQDLVEAESRLGWLV